jgi:hypothetical protein
MKPRTTVATSLWGVVGLLFCLIGHDAGAQLGNNNPNGPAGDYNGSITTAGYMDPFSGNAKRVIDDIVVPGSLGAYPLKWTRYLNTRGIGTGAFGQGGAWNSSYSWALGIWQQLPPQYEPGPVGGLGYPDGRTVDLWAAAGGIYKSITPGLDQVQEDVVKVGGGNYGAGWYDLLLADGGKVKFRPVNGIGLVPLEIVDPYGLTTTLSWVAWGNWPGGRLTKVTEPGGRYLDINYITHTWTDNRGYLHREHLIDNVKAYDRTGGTLIETVRYTYTQGEVGTIFGSVRVYDLTGVDYDDGTHATYTYQDANVIENPYAVAWHLVSTCDDVRYNGPMRQIKYEYVRPGTVAGHASWGTDQGGKEQANR